MSQDNQILSFAAHKASRRAILTAAPAAAVLAGGMSTSVAALGIARAGSGLDWPAIVLRAEGVTDRLQKYYGPDWTAADQEAAAGMLKYCRDRGAALPDDEIAWRATLEFFWNYGQSLDYVMYGDPASMIAKSAARSPRGRPAWEAELDPIFAAVERHREAVRVHEEATAHFRALDEDGGFNAGEDDPKAWLSRTRGSPRDLSYKAWCAAGDVVGETTTHLLDTPPTTIAGAVEALEWWAEFLEVTVDEDVDHNYDFLDTDVHSVFVTNVAAAFRNIIERGQA
jgi:hypothetical protein